MNLPNQKKYRRRWLVQAPLGLILTSAGLCMTIESGFLKHEGVPAMQWILAGTISLVVMNAGLCVLVDALRFHIKATQLNDNL